MGDGAPQDEPARLDAGDLVDLGAGPGLDELVDRPAERPRVAEQGGDVAKQNARLRVIRDGPDRGGKIGHHRLSLVALRSRMFERRSLNAPAIFGRGFNEFKSLRRHSRATRDSGADPLLPPRPQGAAGDHRAPVFGNGSPQRGRFGKIATSSIWSEDVSLGPTKLRNTPNQAFSVTIVATERWRDRRARRPPESLRLRLGISVPFRNPSERFLCASKALPFISFSFHFFPGIGTYQGVARNRGRKKCDHSSANGPSHEQASLPASSDGGRLCGMLHRTGQGRVLREGP